MAVSLSNRLNKFQHKSFLFLTSAKKNTWEERNTLMKNLPILALYVERANMQSKLTREFPIQNAYCSRYRRAAPSGQLGTDFVRLPVPKQKLDTTHEECLAGVCTVFSLGVYLRNSHFIIHTDYKALKWLWTSADALGNLAGQSLWLIKLHFGVFYRTRIEYQALAANSALDMKGMEKTSLNEIFSLLTVNDTEE